MINVTQSSMPPFDEYIREIEGLWASRWLTNMGIKNQSLEYELRGFLGSTEVKLFTNGHLALETAIGMYELKGEVITTPYTFVSTTHAIERNGLVPIFCDINSDDYTIDANKIESYINERTSAIVPVHVYGNVCDVDAIEKLANKYNLKVIYDAAHTFGVEVNGKGVATFGNASMFSFHATKVFHTIEGGAISYSDSTLNGKIDALRNFGITGTDTVDYISGNGKMNEFQAAMGLCNLRHVNDEIVKRSKVVARYDEHLRDISGLKISKVQENIKPNHAYYPVIFDGYKKNRNEVFEELKRYDIIARKYFYPAISELGSYREKHDSNKTPVAKYISERVLCLPLYADLAMEDVDHICSIIKS